MPPQRHSITALNSTFEIDVGYEFVKELGRGAYGCVIAAKHKSSGEGCAIKKITKITSKLILTKRCLREIKLLHHFRGHKNITCLYDMDIVFRPDGDFDEVYLYEELMEADLHVIIRSGQPLTDAHYQSFIYQTLCGLKYIHSANVLHRDIKPGNLVVNADCQLKIIDFGLARGYTPPGQGGGGQGQGQNTGMMTEYVATRWYRAPEIMLSFANYATAIDVWSVGCILAELLGGKPLYQGRDYVDQLNQVLKTLGTPSEETLRRVGSPRAQEYIRSLPIQRRIPFSTIFPKANPLAIDLLGKLLVFDPKERIDCVKALEHPWFEVWHDEADEPDCEKPFNFDFEEENTMEGMKHLIMKEVVDFRAEVRGHQAPQTRLSGSATASQQQRASGTGSTSANRDGSLSLPSRDEILMSPTLQDVEGSGVFGRMQQRSPSPMFEDDPGKQLDTQLRENSQEMSMLVDG